MKKLTAVALTLVMLVSVFALTSCEKVTAYSLVTDAVAKTNALDSFEADMNIAMGMSVMGVTMEVPMDYNIKAAGLKGENPVSFSTIDMSLMGATMTTESYMEGDWCYISVSGQNMKVKVGEDSEEYDGYANIESAIKGLPEEVLSEVEIVENEGGTKTVSVAIEDDKFAEIYKDFIDSMAASATETNDSISDISITNATVEITVDENGYVSVYKMAFDMNIDVETSGIVVGTEASVEMEITFKNPGTAVTITPPEGYQDFPEVDLDALM